MRKIWLVLAAFVLAMPFIATTASDARAAGADTPVQTADDRVLGQADAPVTIFEYASLTCPHCAAFEKETLPKVKTDWIETGKARLIYRDYPLDQAALRASMLARCAPPERYFGFIETLFLNQTTWVTSSGVAAALARIAKLGGISQEKFDQCTNDETLRDAIVKVEYVAQNEYGVDSTPTFFINGKKVVGEASYADFDKELTAAFTAAGGKPASSAAAQDQSSAPAPAGKP